MLKRFGAGLVLASCLLFLLPNLVAADDPDPLKWSQLPNMADPAARDWSSTIQLNTIVADDWQCLNPYPVTDLHWWGSLIEGDQQPAGFVITIYGYVGGPPSQPGPILHQEYHDYYEYWDYGTDAAGNMVYDYVIFLEEPFEQEYQELYFLSIQADLPDGTTNWGWHEAVTHNFDDAVYWGAADGWIPIEEQRGGELVSLDMAFEVSVPEPGTMALFGLGLLGLGARLRRRKES